MCLTAWYPTIRMETLWVLALGVGLILFFNFVLATARAYVVDTASKRIDVQLSANHGACPGFAYGKSPRISWLRSLPTCGRFESVRDFIASASLTTLVDLPFVLLFLVVLAWISPWMVLPPVVAIGLVLLVSFFCAIRPLGKLDGQDVPGHFTTQCAAGGSTDQSGCRQDLECPRRRAAAVGECIAVHCPDGGKIKLISSANVNFVQVMQQLVTVAVVVIGVYLVQGAQLSMGGSLAASIAGRCISPLGQVAGLMMQYHNARTSLASIDNYMKMPVEHGAHKDFVARPVIKGGVEFRQVSFTYPGQAQPALTGVSFQVRPGEKVGVIGRIGSARPLWKSSFWGCTSPLRA